MSKVKQFSLFFDEELMIDDNLPKALNKLKSPKKVASRSVEQKLKAKDVSVEEKIEMVTAEVHKILGSYASNTQVITSENDLKHYIDKAIENGEIAIDTETNNTLDQIQCEIVGLCLYTPGMKNAYVPISHRYFTVDDNGNIVLGEKLEYQLKEYQVKEQLSRLGNSVEKVFHNAAFDIGVIMSTCDIRLKADWDTSIACKILNELENKSLKEQYKIHINPSQDKYDIEHLFRGLPYSIFDPELFALYAATDSFMTLELKHYQYNQFMLPENVKMYKELFKVVEGECIDAVVDMQQTGVCVDIEYAEKMSIEYHKKLDRANQEILDELKRLSGLIDAWKLTPNANARQRVYPAKKTKMSEDDIKQKFTEIDEKGNRYKWSGKTPVEQLTDPIDVGSTTQLQILLYDILKVKVVDKSAPRGTGADILEELSHTVPICKLILNKRDVEILINTFIDKIPKLVKQKTGRVHAKFNQYGADTGRFSSGEKDPDNPKQKSLNLQNIPSHDKFIRMIFKPAEGYAICGADYSAQEVRVLASLSEDENMINAYAENKDLYAVIGSMAFKNDYEDNLEFDPRRGGALNPDGKARRSKAKTLLLGMNYSMGMQSLAENLNISVEEATQMRDNFYSGFKGVDKFTKASQEFLKKNGYVEDAYGRRRHLPDATLPEYTITCKTAADKEFNPLLGSIKHEDKSSQTKIEQYQSKLSKAKNAFQKNEIINKAKADGVSIKNNSGFISRALRQCLNARIQGSSASITKRAMGMIHKDKILNDLGFQLLVTVHDEVFGQAPIENAEKAAERLAEVMVEAAREKCGNVAWKCDPYIVTDGWYEDENVAGIKNYYSKKLKELNNSEDAIASAIDKYLMFNKDSVVLVCNDEYKIGRDSLKYGPNYFNR